MLHTTYDIFFLDNFIERYAKAIGKSVIYLRSYGWNNSSNVDLINQSMEFYTAILPLDIFTSLHGSEFSFVEVDDVNEAAEFLETNFPKSQEACSVVEYYIHYSLYNDQGQLVLSN